MDARPEPRSLVHAAVVFYAAMSAVALILIAAQGLRVVDAVFGPGATAARDAALGAAAGLAVVALTWAARRLGPVRRLNAELGALIGRLDTGQIAVLAVVSAVGEELLFRAALQPLIGFWPTALVFGLMHGGTRRRLWPWAIFATLAGLLLGWLTLLTGSLLAAIACHLTVNFWNLHAMTEPPPPPSSPPGSPR